MLRWSGLLIAAAGCSIICFVLSIIVLYLSFSVYYKLIKKNKKKNYKGRVFLYSVFLSYIVAVLYIIYFVRPGITGINLKPFEGLKEILIFKSDVLGTEAAFMWANILLFMPLGFMLPFINKNINNYKRIAIISILSTLSIETLQLITGKGFFDVDDIIYNFIGGLFGYSIYYFLYTLLFEEKDKWKKILKSFAPLVGCILVVAIVMLSYYIQEYGLLIDVNEGNTDMSNIKVTCDVDVSDTNNKAYTYKVPDRQITKNEYMKNTENLYSIIGSSQREVVSDTKDEYLTISVDEKYTVKFDKEYREYIVESKVEKETEDDYEVIGDEDEEYKDRWQDEVYINNIRNVQKYSKMTDGETKNLIDKFYDKYVRKIDFIEVDNGKYDVTDEYVLYTYRSENTISLIYIYYDEQFNMKRIEVNTNYLKKYKEEEIYTKAEVVDIIKEGKADIGFASKYGIAKIKSIELTIGDDTKGYVRPVYDIVYVYGDDSEYNKITIDAMR